MAGTMDTGVAVTTAGQRHAIQVQVQVHIAKALTARVHSVMRSWRNDSVQAQVICHDHDLPCHMQKRTT